MNEPRLCKSCGAVVDTRIAVCRRCGQAIYTPEELQRIRHEAALAREHKQKKTALLVGVGVVVAIVLGLTASKLGKNDPSCMDRGREFYKELDAYPTMHNGKDAEDHIYEMCTNAKDPDTLFRYNDK